AEVDLEETQDRRVIVDEQDARHRLSIEPAAEGSVARLASARPRSSVDRVPASGAGSAGSSPAGSTHGGRSGSHTEAASLPVIDPQERTSVATSSQRAAASARS